MFEKLKTRCRDECLDNMEMIAEHMQRDIEYFQVSADNKDKDAIKKWAREFEHDRESRRKPMVLTVGQARTTNKYSII